VHLVGLIIRIYHDARSPERQKSTQAYNITKSRVGQLQHIGGPFNSLRTRLRAAHTYFKLRAVLN